MKHAVIHLGWIVVILVLAICALLMMSPDGGLLKDYVSFAGAVSSIILAMIAIIYAFVSNQNISNATASLLESVNSAEHSAGRVKDGAEAIEAAIDSLQAEFGGIAPAVEDITKKLDAANLPFYSGEGGEDIAVSDADKLPVGVSPGLDATLYALALSSLHNNKLVSFEEIFAIEDVGHSWIDYCLGVTTTLMATKPCGLEIARDIGAEGRRGSYSVVKWGELVPEELRAEVVQEGRIPSWAKQAIDLYFS